MNVQSIIRIRQSNGLRIFGISEEAHKESLKQQLDKLMVMAVNRYSKHKNFSEEEIQEYNNYFSSMKLPTDLQDPGMYLCVSSILDSVMATATKINQWNGDVPTIASEYGGEINGYCFADGTGNVGIVLDESLMVFTQLLAKIVAPMLFHISDDGFTVHLSRADMFKGLSDDNNNLNRFHDLFCSYVQYGTTSRAKPYLLPDSKYDVVVDVLRNAMQRFVVAHECGHIFHRDFADKWMNNNNSDFLSSTIDGKLTVSRYRHQKELDADGFALNLIFNSLDPEDQLSRFQILGPVLFLLAIETLEKYIFFGLTGRNQWDNFEDALGSIMAEALPSTHPRPFIRRNLLVRAVENSPVPNQLKNLLLKFNNSINIAFMEAEAKSQSMLKQQHESLLVHPSWLRRKHEFAMFSELGSLVVSAKSETCPSKE